MLQTRDKKTTEYNPRNHNVPWDSMKRVLILFQHNLSCFVCLVVSFIGFRFPSELVPSHRADNYMHACKTPEKSNSFPVNKYT